MIPAARTVNLEGVMIVGEGRSLVFKKAKPLS